MAFPCKEVIITSTYRVRLTSFSFNISFSLSCGNDKDSSGSNAFPSLKENEKIVTRKYVN